MKRPVQVGITGGIGSGKSLICRIFKCVGIEVYDADTRAKNLMVSHPMLVKEIINSFGEDAYLEGGELNREKLRREVFNQPEKLKQLNQLVHPRVVLDYENWVSQNSERPYLLKEAALLYESGSAKTLDKIIVVTAPESLRVARVVQRDGKSDEEVRKIMDQQMDEEEKIKRADFIIENNEKALVIPQVLSLHQILLRLRN